MSFKIYKKCYLGMCGGQQLWVPCSRVGHIYRLEGWDGNPPPPYTPKNPSLKNYMRVVEVWWDDYKKYFYTTRPETIGLDYGDISLQKQFRIDNKCKDFNWFMKEVAYDIPESFPLPPLNLFWGELRSKGGTMCLDSMGKKGGNGESGQYWCHKQGGNQLWRLTEGYQLAQYDQCLSVMGRGHTAQPGSKLGLFNCGLKDFMDWEWIPVSWLVSSIQ